MTTAYYISTALSDLQEAIDITYVPNPVEVGVRQSVPFTVSISAFDDGPHVIDLYAQYSNSHPYQQPQNKWSHLVPQWRFLDAAYNPITHLTTNDTPLSSGSTFIGVTGVAEFYYVDDMPSTAGNPAVLWATMQVSGLPLYSESDNGRNPVPSYANSKVVDYTPYFINGLIPSHLNITRDGIVPLSAGVYWRDHKIPNIINIAPNRFCSYVTSGIDILYDVPDTNVVGTTMGAVEKDIAVVPVLSQKWTSLDTGSSDSYFQRYDKDGYVIGGYVKNTVTSNLETPNANITASVGLDVSYYHLSADTAPYYHTPYAWVADPNDNILHRISKPLIDSTIVDAITGWLFSEFIDTHRSLDTPFITATDITDVMGLTGFGGIYGIAVDPCYNVWCADAEMDKLYKFSWEGSLLSSIDLNLEIGLKSTNLFTTDNIKTLDRHVNGIPTWGGGGSYGTGQQHPGPIAITNNWLAVGQTITNRIDMFKYDDTNFINNNWVHKQVLTPSQHYFGIYEVDMVDDRYLLVKTSYYLSLYENINDTWTLIKEIYDGYLDGGTGSAIDSNHFIYRTDVNVVIYTRISDVWTLTYDQPMGDFHPWGISNPVDIYGNTAIIGTPRSYNSNGAIQVFDYNESTETWSPCTQTLTSFETPGATFPRVLEIYDDWIVTGTQSGGAMHLYQKTNNTWVSAQYIDPRVDSGDDWRGDLKLHGDRFVITTNNGLGTVLNPNNEGYLKIYTNQNNTWTQTQALSSPTLYHNNVMRYADVATRHVGVTQVGQSSTSYTPTTANVLIFRTNDSYFTPSDICLDGVKNMYIPLYGGNNVVKYDQNGVYQYTLPTHETTILNIDQDTATDTTPLSNYLFLPVMVDTDRDNNVWSTYNQSLCSVMYKHDSNGAILSTIALPLCSNPMDILVDYDNNVWVALSYESGPAYYLGEVKKYNGETGAEIANISSINPEYLTMDKQGDIWYTFDVNSIGKINYTSTDTAHASTGFALTPTISTSPLHSRYSRVVLTPTISASPLPSLPSISSAYFGEQVFIEDFNTTLDFDGYEYMVNNVDMTLNTASLTISRSFTGNTFETVTLLNDGVGGLYDAIINPTVSGYLNYETGALTLSGWGTTDTSYPATSSETGWTLPISSASVSSVLIGYVSSAYFGKQVVIENFNTTLLGGYGTIDNNTVSLTIQRSVTGNTFETVTLLEDGVGGLYDAIINPTVSGYLDYNTGALTLSGWDTIDTSYQANSSETGWAFPVSSANVSSVLAGEYKYYEVTTAAIGSYPIGAWFVGADVPQFNALEGLAVDANNRVWVVNAYERLMYVLSGSVDNVIDTMNLTGGRTNWYLDSNLQIQTVSGDWYNSLQANGDWTGYRWLQKYNTTVSNTITGDSGPFVIDSIQNYDLRKFNESWDATTQIRDYALPEHFYNNYNLFVNYIGTMIGGLETSANSIARKVYERTANYVANHSDVDTCNIPQLYSLAQEVDVPVDDYNFTFPEELKRIMDIVSISQRKLWGGRCKCNLNFRSAYGLCTNCGHNHPSNIGDGINTDTYAVSTGVTFLAEYKFTKNVYELLTPINNYSTVYNLASTYLINDPQDYCYFEYISTMCDIQNEGIINWDDEYTTLNESISSLEKWYNNNETVEKLLSYYIHQGLGFYESGGSSATPATPSNNYLSIEPCESLTGWSTPLTVGSLSLYTVTPPQGDAGVQLTNKGAPGDPGDTLIAGDELFRKQSITSVDLSDYSYLSFWIYESTNELAGLNLTIKLFSTIDCTGTPEEALDFFVQSSEPDYTNVQLPFSGLAGPSVTQSLLIEINQAYAGGGGVPSYTMYIIIDDIKGVNV